MGDEGFEPSRLFSFRLYHASGDSLPHEISVLFIKGAEGLEPSQCCEASLAMWVRETRPHETSVLPLVRFTN